MRIAQIVETLEKGGLERMAVDLATEQRAAGHQPLLYCIFGEGPLAGQARAAGIPVTSFNKQPGISIRLPLQLARQLRKDRVEVLHSHNPGVHPYAAVAGRFAGVSVVINTRHGPMTSMGLAYDERYFRLVMPLTDHVVSVSDHSRRFLLSNRAFRNEKSSVIPNGIRIDHFASHRAEPGSMRPRIRFGTVGRLVPAKHHAMLIEAFASVAKLLPDTDLRIVGDGPLEDELRRQIHALGLEARVTLEGGSSNIAEFLRDLDVFVLSSKSEGLPMVILEAMAAGLPIVSTRVGGVPEVAPEDVAWFCGVADPEGLAHAMYQAAMSPNLAVKGEQAWSIASSTLSTSAMQQRYEALYRKHLCRT
jgi:glycosyltransferase involved in cell wall biosynthesis